MELRKIDIEEFKKDIYSEYKKIFPIVERKSYRRLKKAYKNQNSDIIEVNLENETIGFIIVNSLKGNPYVILDYFAIFPQYQSKGYGTEAIKLLKEMYKQYKGIFIEIEKLGEGKTEQENNLRKRRAKFYEKLGFYKLSFDLRLYGVTYSPYMFDCYNSRNLTENQIIECIFNIYFAVMGEKKINKNCKVIN